VAKSAEHATVSNAFNWTEYISLICFHIILTYFRLFSKNRGIKQ